MLWCSAELLKARRALICRCEPRAPWKTLLWAVLGSKVSSPHAAAHVCRGLGQFISSFCRSEAVYFIYCLACLSSSLYLGTPEVALLIPNAQESSRRFSRDASKSHGGPVLPRPTNPFPKCPDLRSQRLCFYLDCLPKASNGPISDRRDQVCQGGDSC